MRIGMRSRGFRVRSTAFTLLELIVVVLILAILAGLVLPNVMGVEADARVKRAKADVKSIANAINMYKLDNFSYPSTQQGLAALVQKPAGQPEAPNWRKGGYLQGNEAPKDPWQRPYLYVQPGQHGDFDVYSLGADGKPGGNDADADIGHWMQN